MQSTRTSDDQLDSSSDDELLPRNDDADPNYQELVLWYQQYVVVSKNSTGVKVAGTAGAVVGAIASVEFYLLGMEFVNIMARMMDVKNPIIIMLMQHLFGLISFVPNSSMNVLVNMEISQDIYTLLSEHPYNLQLVKKILKYFPIEAHSLIAGLALTAVFIKNIADMNLSMRITLGLCGLVSNTVLFHYTDVDCMHSVTDNWRYLRNNLSDKQLKNILHARLKQLRREAYGITHDSSNNFMTAPELFRNLIKIDFDTRTNYQRFTKSKIALGASGLLIGALGVGSYFNVGREASDTICAATSPENCYIDNEFSRSFLGVNLLTAFLLFSCDQCVNGLIYLQQQLSNPLNLSVVMLALFSLASSIANGSIATGEELEDKNNNMFLSVLVIISAFLSPSIVNNKWCNEVYERISNQLDAMTYFLQREKSQATDSEKIEIIDSKLAACELADKRNQIIAVIDNMYYDVDKLSHDDLLNMATKLIPSNNLQQLPKPTANTTSILWQAKNEKENSIELKKTQLNMNDA